MEKITNQERLKPWMGVALFAVMMGLFVTVCAYMQLNWGIPGLILTELLLLGLAVLFCKIRKVKIKEVFPVKKIKAREFFGCGLLLAGVYLISLLSVYIMMFFFPSTASETAELGSFLYGNMNYICTLLVVAFLPAICEEAFHRGAVLSSFRGVKHEWVAIIAVGLMFSINHMSILRGPFTFIFGCALAYVVVKKNNILLSILMHCMLNASSVSIVFLQNQAGEDVTSAASTVSVSGTLLGGFMVISCIAPFLILLGITLLTSKEHIKSRAICAGVLSAVLLVGGFACCFKYYTPARPKLLDSMYGFTVSKEGETESVDFTTTKEGDYRIYMKVSEAKGTYRMSVCDSNGNEVCGANATEDAPVIEMIVDLAPDHYTYNIICLEDCIGESPRFTCVVQ